MLHRVLSTAEKTLGCALRVDGDIGLLERPRRALLISRGERNPTPGDARIQATLRATQHLLDANEVLVAGTDRHPWDLALWTCRQRAGSAVVALCDGASRPDFLPENVLCVWPESNAQPADKTARLLLRDRLAGLLASSAYSLQIRPGGNMARIADELTDRGCNVEAWTVETLERPEAQPLDQSHEVAATAPIPPADCLTHFTREPDGLWPNERYADFLHWLSSGPTFTPRDAFHSLRRMASEKRIQGCGRLIGGGTPMVCLTQRDPASLLADNQWRKGLQRWMYSHYALSFDRAALVALGARPVRYGDAATLSALPSAERCFAQVASSAGIDWRNEAEWRVRGDLDFSSVRSEHVTAWVATPAEAAAIAREFQIRALVISPREL